MSVPRRRRVALTLLVTAAAACCLALGWWQWSRWESTAGSFQNLGYALQWPMFAAFCVYAYRKFIRYEEAPPQQPGPDRPTELPPGLLPERPAPAPAPQDATMRAYNAYLAELAASEHGVSPTPDQNRTAR